MPNLLLFSRHFTHDLKIPSEVLVLSFYAHPRIKVNVYNDMLYYQAIFEIDGIPVIKEVLLTELQSYIKTTQAAPNLHAFLLELVA